VAATTGLGAVVGVQPLFEAIKWAGIAYLAFLAIEALSSAQPGGTSRAWEASITAGVTLFDTAAMYAGGASERRLGELSSNEALIATKFPATLWASADDMPGQLADSLARLRRDYVDVYQHHFPSRRVDIPRLMNLMADAVAAGQVRAVGVSNYSTDQMRQAHAAAWHTTRV
jgi:aryl-alcohol dehydrogenase-like predicted oxidoreductase